MKLEDFLATWIKERPFLIPVESPLDMEGVLHGVVLYREDDLQVQLFTVEPNAEIPDHIHPNVDSFEVYLSGEIAFRHSGEYVTTPEMWGDSSLVGKAIRVRPNDSHGGKFGPKGGSFLSVQQWLNGVKPTSVGHDWAFTSADRLAKSYTMEAGKTVFYDAEDGRMVAEVFQGRVYLHLEIRRWGMESARKLRGLWPQVKKRLKEAGFDVIYAYNRESEARWPRFMSWFGFNQLGIANGWRLMRCANA